MLKTYEGWIKGSLCEYLQIGDKVDEEMVNYFINVLPPATMTSILIQIGEPYNHIEHEGHYLPIYATLSKAEGVWEYAGHCLRGSFINKG